MQTAPETRDTKACPACGGVMRSFIRTTQPSSGKKIVYFICDRCAHVIITEE